MTILESSLAAVAVKLRLTDLREFRIPDVPPDAGILRVVTGICGSDWPMYLTEQPGPRILGHEMVGIVEQLGDLARDRWGVREGDYVAVEAYLPCGHCGQCRIGEYRACAETDRRVAGSVRYGSTPISKLPSLWGGYSQYLYLHPRSVFGRNEECGLRCIYHGWKFDVHGTCLDRPSEPPNSSMKPKIKLLSYPTVERSGIVWAFLGPTSDMPDPPDYEWLRAPPTDRFVSKTHEHCNYLQALEGGLDTAHSSFPHDNGLGNGSLLRTRNHAPAIEVHRSDYGYSYASSRDVGEDGKYVRVYHYVMPFQQMRANYTVRDGRGREQVPKLDGHLWVPIDDANTHVYNWACAYDEATPLTREYMEAWEARYGRAKEDLIPGTFKLRRGADNDYQIDREVQARFTYSGITGVNTQDYALQEGMGPIVDRSKERLGSSDRAIIVMRSLLLEATRAVERGERPKGADPALP